MIDPTHLKARRTASLLKKGMFPAVSDWLRRDLAEHGIKACSPSRAKRKEPILHDVVLYRQRHKIEMMFGRIKDWRSWQPATTVRSHLLLRHLHRCNRHLLD